MKQIHIKKKNFPWENYLRAEQSPYPHPSRHSQVYGAEQVPWPVQLLTAPQSAITLTHLFLFILRVLQSFPR